MTTLACEQANSDLNERYVSSLNNIHHVNKIAVLAVRPTPLDPDGPSTGGTARINPYRDETIRWN